MNFLEPSSSEYDRTRQLLPSRSLAPEPIPWPTIFAPSSSSETARPSRSHRCDAVARLVAEGNLAEARTLVEELRSLHVGILHRVEYIQAALRSLDHTEAGREAFFFWLELVPNRPAIKAYPSLNEPWHPLIQRLRQHHTMDADLIEQVMLHAARKGVLPSVAAPLGKHLAHLVPFDKAMDVMRTTLRVYFDAVTARRSGTARAISHHQHAQDRVRDTWKAYLYVLAQAHRYRDRSELFASPMEGVEDAFDIDPASLPALERSTYDWSTFGENGRTDPAFLRRRAAEALEGKVSIREFASVLSHLERYGHAAFVGMLERQFVAPSAEHPYRADLYWHTRIYMLVQQRRNQEAVELFQRRYHWIGMPDHPLRSAESDPADVAMPIPAPGLFDSDASDGDRIYPSSGTLTTLLPALLHTLPNGQLVPFHQKYLAMADHLPSRLRLNAVGLDDFLRHIIRRMHPKQSIKAYYHALAAGKEPQVAAWNRFLQVCGRRKLDHFFIDVLRAMELGRKYATFALPKPNAQTYKMLAETLKPYPEYAYETQLYYRKGTALRNKEIVKEAARDQARAAEQQPPALQ